MNVLVFDNRSQQRARLCAISLKDAGATTHWHYQGTYYTPDGQETSAFGNYDCVILHHPNEAEFVKMAIQAMSILRYSGGGSIVGGVGRAITASNPLTLEEAKAILDICNRFKREDQQEEFTKIWSGVSETLLAWVLVQHVSGGALEVEFDEKQVRDGFNNLRNNIAARKISAGLPDKCDTGWPDVEHTKRLISLAREAC